MYVKINCVRFNNTLMIEIKDSIELVEYLNSITCYVNDTMKELSSEISLYDLQEQDILHFIENKGVGASNMSKLFKLIREVRGKRRKCKNEFMRLQSLSTKLRNKETCLLDTKFEIKDLPNYYDFKTNVLESIGFIGCNIGGRMCVDDGSIKTISYSTVDTGTEAIIGIKTDITHTTEEHIVMDRSYVDTKIDEVISSDGVDCDSDDDKEETLCVDDLDSIFNHPEGRCIIRTNPITGEVVKSKNLEAAVNKVLFSTKGVGNSVEDYVKKPSLLVKNISGIIKAIKMGNMYLGYKWEAK